MLQIKTWHGYLNSETDTLRRSDLALPGNLRAHINADELACIKLSFSSKLNSLNPSVAYDT